MTVERIALIIFVVCSSLILLGVSFLYLGLIGGIAGLIWAIATVVEGLPRTRA